MAESSVLVRKERNSTIELLRILCMLAVIAHHCVVHGGAMGMEPCANKYIASLILPLGKISFTCFVAISMWFLVDQKFRANRFIRAWLEVLFYTFLMMFSSVAMGAEVTTADWLGSFLPIGGNSHGFAATYLAFYLLLPILNRLTSDLTKRQTIWCLVLLGYVQVMEPVLAQLGLANLTLHPFVSEITLFGFCFFAALYLKRWAPEITKNTFAMGLVATAVWAVVVGMTIQGWRVGGVWSSVSSMLASGENSILYLVGGFSLFLCFNSLPIAHSRVINAIASTTFGVLLIHDHNFFRSVLWNGIVDAPNWWYSQNYLLLVVLYTTALFLICSLVDFLRQKIIEQPVLNLPVSRRAACWMDGVWGNMNYSKDDEGWVDKTSIVPDMPSNRVTAVQKCHAEQFVRWGALIVLVGTGLFFLVNFVTRSAYISTYFSVDWQDTFMDYFNMLECVRKGDPYYADSNYPAIVFIILKILFHFVPHEALVAFDDPRLEAMALRETMVAMLPFLIVLIVCLLVICICIRRILGEFSSLTKNTATSAVVLSGPVLFLFERGNVLLFSLTFLLIFFAYYESDNRLARNLACVALGLAASIKLYPAIFALLLLSKKRYKEFFITFASGLAFLILPFFVFNGVESMKVMIGGLTLSSDMANTSGFGHNYSFSNLASIVSLLLGLNGRNLGLMGTVIPLALCLTAFFIAQRDWERVLACSMACILTPSFSYTYSLVMMVPVLLLLAKDEHPWGKYKITCGLLLLFVMIPIASPMVSCVYQAMPEAKFALTWGCLLGNIALISLLGLVAAHRVKDVSKQRDYS